MVTSYSRDITSYIRVLHSNDRMITSYSRAKTNYGTVLDSRTEWEPVTYGRVLDGYHRVVTSYNFKNAVTGYHSVETVQIPAATS